jgi:hypothetical protein
LAGGKFTWSNNQKSPTLENLDRIIISKEREDFFPTCMVFKLPREVSDHNPLILSTNTNHPLKHLSFIYELSWIKHPDFMPNVQKIWEVPCHTNCELTRIQKKLKKSNNSLRGRALINKVNKKRKG